MLLKSSFIKFFKALCWNKSQKIVVQINILWQKFLLDENLSNIKEINNIIEKIKISKKTKLLLKIMSISLILKNIKSKKGIQNIIKDSKYIK